MKIAAEWDRIIAVHAELPDGPIRAPKSHTEWSRQRPIRAEVSAIDLACDLAGRAGAKLHIVHISSVAGVLRGRSWRRRGVDVSLETCPHYLFLDTRDAERLGPFAKCMPPLRSPQTRAALQSRLVDDIDIVASDHAPHRLEDKVRGLSDFAAAPAGLSTNQFLVPLTATLLSNMLGERRGLTLFCELAAARQARRFGLRNRGTVSAGAIASFVVLSKKRGTVRSDTLANMVKYTPLEGLTIKYEVARTILHGATVYAGGEGVDESARGEWLKW
jgi:allantoinase